MKPTIENLQDTFKYSYEQFWESRREALRAFDYYHNRQFDEGQLMTLANRGQPAETFNVVKRYSRMLIGFLSTVVNTIKVKPRQTNDVATASLLGDLIDYTMARNNFVSEAVKLKMDCILTGLMCVHLNVKETGKFDRFNRPIREVQLTHIPVHEIVLDPMSQKEDYSDARFIHRFKWISEEQFIEAFGEAKLKNLEAYDNFLEQEDTEFEYSYNGEFQGKYKRYDNYLIVHSVVRDKGKTWSVFWSGDTILSKKQVKYRKLKFPYRIQKLNPSHRPEYYGLFREVFETQDAINQAIIKIQLAVNSQKAFVQEGAVENIEEFKDCFNRVNAICEVKNINGIKIENTTREVQDLYTVVDRALDRIQSLLCINDSFLGLAPASDSGVKVQKQQNATVVALEHLTIVIKNFYRMLGWDILALIQQYYTATQAISIADPFIGQRVEWINVPYEIYETDENGNPLYIDPYTGDPVMRIYEEAIDVETGQPYFDDNGFAIMAPIPTEESEITFTEADIDIESVAYNNENETTTQLIDAFLNGTLGQMLSQIDPASYLQVGALALRQLKTKVSPEIAKLLEQAAESLRQQQMQAQQPMGGQQ